MKNKVEFLKPEAELVIFQSDDIIVTSLPGQGEDLGSNDVTDL